MSIDAGDCPLCAGPVRGGYELHVCRKCHAGLQLTGAISLTTTSEFQAMDPPSASSEQEVGATGAAQPLNEDSCSWCDKAQSKVRKLLSRGGCHICDECVALCADVMAMELGDSYGGD